MSGYGGAFRAPAYAARELIGGGLPQGQAQAPQTPRYTYDENQNQWMPQPTAPPQQTMAGTGFLDRLLQPRRQQPQPTYPGTEAFAPTSDYGAYAARGPYNIMAGEMAQGRFGMPSFGAGGFGYTPYGGMGGPIRGSWPGFGIGGMPGRFGGAHRGGPGYGGYFGGSGFGFSGGYNPYGPGSYGAPGAMPFGGGSGMWGQYISPFGRF